MLDSAVVRSLVVLLLVHGVAVSASGWDRVGHLVVDAIAWKQLSDTARARATELLRAAPPDTDLALPALDARELFLRAGYWPDIVRDDACPSRKEKYDRPTWHYVNHFWRDGKILTDRGTSGELIERLDLLSQSLSTGIELAWLMHLVGDIHQPLHSSARVTARDPEGDRGGNDFLLNDLESWGNLHGYWDAIQRRVRRKRHSESFDAWVSRIAREIMELHPRDSLEDDLRIDGFEQWSRAGAELAMRRAYPGYLVRDGAPPERYQDEVQEVADRQLALAGYRLAGLLNELLGP